MNCLKKPYRPTQPAICNNCRRRCERAGKYRGGKRQRQS